VQTSVEIFGSPDDLKLRSAQNLAQFDDQTLKPKTPGPFQEFFDVGSSRLFFMGRHKYP
jgi:hypothetical protein